MSIRWAATVEDLQYKLNAQLRQHSVSFATTLKSLETYLRERVKPEYGLQELGLLPQPKRPLVQHSMCESITFVYEISLTNREQRNELRGAFVFNEVVSPAVINMELRTSSGAGNEVDSTEKPTSTLIKIYSIVCSHGGRFDQHTSS